MDVIAKVTIQISDRANGYIAGSGDGIVTVNGRSSARYIYILDAENMQFIQRVLSLSNGHYIVRALDATKQYIVMARDYKREYEPAVWDYVTPATDLTIAQQQELWQSWQTST